MAYFHVNSVTTTARIQQKLDDNSYQVVVRESPSNALGSRCVGCQLASVNCNTNKKHSNILVKSHIGQCFDVGDEVSLSLESHGLLKRCLLTYIVPLIVFLVLAVIFDQVIEQNVWVGIATFASFLLVTWMYILGVANNRSCLLLAPLVIAFSNNNLESESTQKL